MDPARLRNHVKTLAASLGFDACGVARAEPIGRAEYLRRWLDSGRDGTMDYLHRHFNERIDPCVLLPGARSVIVVALLYHQHEPGGDVARAAPRLPIADCQLAIEPPGNNTPNHVRQEAGSPLRGRVAMYAWGDDYHVIVKGKLHALVDRLRGELSMPFEARCCVDTAPVLERELAAAAGIGWIGKNTMVLSRELGSYFFLGEVVTTLDIAADEPVADHCGSCTACLEACPTQAFPAPYQMDASRCISYLTIEHRGDISRPFAEMMGDWVFGCDVCQDVCPFNRKAPETREPGFAVRPPGPAPALDDILSWTREQYRKTLRGSAMKRAKLDMLKRNAGIAKGNLRLG